MAIPSEVLQLIRDEQTRQDDLFIPDAPAFLVKLDEKAELLAHLNNGHCAGFVFFYCNTPDKESSFITLIAVSPSVRGQGVGGSLVRHVFNITRARGFKFCRLEVRKNNEPAMRLYRAQGFAVVEDRGEKYLMQARMD